VANINLSYAAALLTVVSLPRKHISWMLLLLAKSITRLHTERAKRGVVGSSTGKLREPTCTVPTSTPKVLNANSRDISASRHSGSKPHSRYLKLGWGDRTSWIRQPSFLSFYQWAAQWAQPHSVCRLLVPP